MPRQSRIDAPGAWQHIIAHEIGRCKIFNGDLDRDNFVERLDTVNGSYYIFLFFIFRRAVVFHLMFGADALTKNALTPTTDDQSRNQRVVCQDT